MNSEWVSRCLLIPGPIAEGHVFESDVPDERNPVPANPGRRHGLPRAARRVASLVVLALTGLAAVTPTAAQSPKSDSSEKTVCERTVPVRDAIVAAVPGVDDCVDVLDVHLTDISRLEFHERSGLVKLEAGDFAGLTGLRTLTISRSSFANLPEGIFDELTGLQTLSVTSGDLSSLPAGVFDRLAMLRSLNLGGNKLIRLPAGIFENLVELEFLNLNGNSLTSLRANTFSGLGELESLGLARNELSTLPAGVFDSLGALLSLALWDTGLTRLPAGAFDRLTALTQLALYDNDLSSLPAGIFDRTTALTMLYLHGNELSRLPDGIFKHLASLSELSLHDNPGSAGFKPTANAGGHRTVSTGATVTLDGSASGGPWGTNVTYSWAVAEDSTVRLDDAESGTPGFTAPESATDVVFTLTVTGAGNDFFARSYTDSDTATVKVTNQAVITGITFSSPPRTYAIGDRIRVTVTFSEAVEVTTTDDSGPQLELDIGGEARRALYVSGTGSSATVFAYTVRAGDEDRDGIAIGADSLSVPDGSAISGESSGLSAVLSHGALAPDAARTVDGVRPALSSVGVVGDSLMLTYSEDLNPNVVPAPGDFTVEVGGHAVDPADFDPIVVSGSTVMLPLPMTVSEGESVMVTYIPPSAPNAAIEDEAGNRAFPIAEQRLGDLFDGALRLMGGTVPHEGRLEIYNDGQWGTVCDDYWTGDDADVACRALGYESGAANNGGSILRAHFGPAAEGVPIWLDNMLCRGDEANLLLCPRAAQAGGIPAVGEHNCSLKHLEDVGVRCDPAPAPPHVVSAPQVSDPPGENGRYDVGETVEVTLVFSKAVIVDTAGGTPRIWLRLDDERPAHAAYERGSGTERLVFAYTIPAPEGGPDDPADSFETVGVARSSLWLYGGTIRGEADGVDAVLAHRGVNRGQGQATLSVADAQALEGIGAVLAFEVTLNPSRSETTRVDYATSDGTAMAGEDYISASGTLVFEAGVTSQTIEVTVLDDADDEGTETLTLTLSNPRGARIEDGTAIGTIENTDAMPKAWLARFGRTVGAQLVDAVSAQVGVDRRGRSEHVTIGGIRLGEGAPAKALEERVGFGGDPWRGAHDETRSPTARELLMRSSFRLSGGGAGGAPLFSTWGQLATGGFDARVDDLWLEGDVITAMLGADAEWNRALAGTVLSVSDGEGSYRLATGDGTRWTVRNSLTSISPYARFELNERLSVWGLAGSGSGELTLRRDARESRPVRTGVSMRLGALGAWGAVLAPATPGGPALDLKADALFVRTESDAVDAVDAGNLVAASADVSRFRLLLEGRRTLELGAARTLTPALELGLRRDAGDAETGSGVEAGVSLRYADPARGLFVEGRVRTLLAHEEGDYEEWGASGSVRIAPGVSGRGLSLTLAPTWGNASSGVQRLWGLNDAHALGRTDGFEPRGGLETQLGYGVGLSHNRGVLTPYTGLSLGRGGTRTMRAGARWALGRDVTLKLEAAQRDAGRRALSLRAAMRF